MPLVCLFCVNILARCEADTSSVRHEYSFNSDDSFAAMMTLVVPVTEERNDYYPTLRLFMPIAMRSSRHRLDSIIEMQPLSLALPTRDATTAQKAPPVHIASTTDALFVVRADATACDYHPYVGGYVCCSRPRKAISM